MKSKGFITADVCRCDHLASNVRLLCSLLIIMLNVYVKIQKFWTDEVSDIQHQMFLSELPSEASKYVPIKSYTRSNSKSLTVTENNIFKVILNRFL